MGCDQNVFVSYDFIKIYWIHLRWFRKKIKNVFFTMYTSNVSNDLLYTCIGLRIKFKKIKLLLKIRISIVGIIYCYNCLFYKILYFNFIFWYTMYQFNWNLKSE